MKFLQILFVFACVLYASKNETTNINKPELILENNKRILKQIDEEQQNLIGLKAAFEALQKEKEEQNAKKQKELEQILKSIEDEKNKNQELLDKIDESLKKLNELTNEKIITSFSKMKEGPAATILDAMETVEAANILRFLEPKKMGQILAKMPPQKAAQISLIISNNQLFDNSKEEEKKEDKNEKNTDKDKKDETSQPNQKDKDRLKELSKTMANQ